jgi:GH24 family phage-related lysozyme (muramidase)
MGKPTLSGQVRDQYLDNSSGRVNLAFGVYTAIVKKTYDEDNMGRLRVWIPEFKGDPEDEDQWSTVQYCSPFAGSTDPFALGNNAQSFQDTQKSYGFWAVPPDINNEVVVSFLNGDLSKGIWFGNLYQKASNYTVPGLAHGTTYGAASGEYYPSAEKNKKDPDNNSDLRPKHTTLGQALNQQGLLKDLERGAGTSSSHRESPSKVVGILTPGQHQFVMDDGDSSGGNKLIRFRTANGAQILIDDTFGMIYFINRDGTAWMELSQEGHIDAYAGQGINLNATGDFNIRSGGNINIEAAGNLNIKADNIKGLANSALHLSSITGTRLSSNGNTEIGSGGDHIESAANIHMNGPTATLADAPDVNQLPVNTIVRKSVASRVPEHEPWKGHATTASTLSRGQSSQSAASADGSADTPSNSPAGAAVSAEKMVDTSDITPTENMDTTTKTPIADMHVSKNIVDYIISKERWRPIEYWDYRSNSIGFGHLQDGKSYDQANEFDNGLDWDAAYNKFLQDILSFEKSIKSMFKSSGSMTQNQFDALVSAAYNMGPGNLGKCNANGKSITDNAASNDWENVGAALAAYPTENARRQEEAVILLKGYYPPSNKNKQELINEGLKVAKSQVEGNRAQIKGPAIEGRVGAFKPVFGAPTERQKQQWAVIKVKYGL